MKEFKKLVLVISMLLMTSCGLQLQIGSANINTSKTQKVKVYTTTFQTIKNLDPWQLGLHSGGNWFLCRTHGFHDLNDWTDFDYSPVFCRSSRGFIAGTRWNSSWNWNNNIWGHNRFDRFGFNNRWGNQRYYGWNNYNNQGYPYWGNNVYNGNYRYGSRSNNLNNRWKANKPNRIINKTSTRNIRTNTTTRSIRSINKPIRSINKPIRSINKPIRSIINKPIRRTKSKVPRSNTNRTNTRTNTRRANTRSNTNTRSKKQ